MNTCLRQPALSLPKPFSIQSLLYKTLTFNHVYLCPGRSQLPLKMQLYKKLNTFWDFFIAFLESPWKLQHFQKELHRLSIFEIIDSKRCGYLSSYNVLFLETLAKWKCLEIWKTAQICRKAILYPFFTTLSRIELKKLFLVRFEIWGLLISTFTPNHVYVCPNKERLPLHRQMQLSEKPKTFCCFLLLFWNQYDFFKKHWASYLKYFWNY